MAVIAFAGCQLGTVYANTYAGLFCATIITQFVCAHGQYADFVSWKPLQFNLTENAYGFGQVFSALAIVAVWLQFLNPSGFLGAQLGSLSWINAPAGAIGRESVLFLSGGAFMVYSAYSTLLDAAQRGRLGASTFKLLNLATGLLGLLWGYVSYTLYQGGVMTSLCMKEVFSSFATYTTHIADVFSFKTSAAFVVIGLVCLVQYVTAKK